MSSSIFKAPGILEPAPKQLGPNGKYVGFFWPLQTCDTIQEGIDSFDKLEEKRRIKMEKPFAYKS